MKPNAFKSSESSTKVDRHRTIPFFKAILSIGALALLFFSLTFYLTRGFGALDVQPQENLDEYTWADLKAIAAKIEDAATDEDGYAIARRFNLVDDSGAMFADNTKSYTLNNGSKSQIRIANILHEEKADGSGKAGITFCFEEPVTYLPMDGSDNLGVSWTTSELRDWLNTEFVNDYLKQGAGAQLTSMTRYIVSVSTGETPSTSEDATETAGDLLWLLSIEEYSDKRLMDDPAALPIESKPYWLRSPLIDAPGYFYCVDANGSTRSENSSSSLGVLPFFCF